MEPTRENNSADKQKSNSTLDDAIAKVAGPVTGSADFPSSAASTAQSGKPKRKRRGKLIAWLIFLLLIIIIAAGGFMAWKMGYLYGGTKEPVQEVRLDTVVCDEDIVNRYNESALRISMESGQDGLRDLANEIKSDPNYTDDATCQTILFLQANNKGDIDAMQTTLGLIQQLNSLGIFPNNNIIGNLPLMVMEQLVTQAINPTGEMPDSTGEGE